MNIKRIPTFPDYYCTNDGIILDKFFRNVPIYPKKSQELPFYPPWKVPKTKKKINPYKMVYLKRKPYKRCALKSVHSIVATTWVSNPRPDIFKTIDHIDRNEHNNHPSNLRWVTHAMNGQNNDGLNCYFVKKQKLPNGRFKTINKWYARVTLSGVRHSLGMYDTFREGYLVSNKFKRDNFLRNYKYMIEDESPRVSNYLFLDGPEDVASTS